MTYSLLRLFSLWLFGSYVLQYFSMTLAQIIYDIGSGGFNDIELYTLLMNLFLFTFWLTVSGLLWFKAEYYSMYFQLSEIGKSKDKKSEIENYSKFLQISIIILGLFFTIKSIPELVTGFIHLGLLKDYYNPYQIDSNLVNLTRPALTFILGMLCLSFNKVVVLFFNKVKGM